MSRPSPSRPAMTAVADAGAPTKADYDLVAGVRIFIQSSRDPPG
jgi:hypothetical protein